MERLDKVLSNLGYGTRKEIKQVVKKGFVTVNDEKVKDSGLQIDPEKDTIVINGEKVEYKKYIYLMMNKPAGVISATYDKRDETVIDLLYMEDQVFEPFPVGRLDKDTTGMLIITDDGDFAHRMLSPKKHVEKVYKATLDGEVTDEMVENFRKGISFYDGTLCLSAKLLPNKGNPHIARVIIREGKYHQVKKMFLTQGLTVKDLHREQIGMLKLPKDLAPGECRFMQEDEKRNIFL